MCDWEDTIDRSRRWLWWADASLFDISDMVDARPPGSVPKRCGWTNFDASHCDSGTL
ncbi:hypothetical protein KP509_16G055400 [Ceratopteris richardii]|uniref:Uncharacterized protein n=1 Tax=Ceratopteris richardii TaxID=49495 RepID=A0A8T2SZ18_CERRI|nr:hypothetical protein KP509_16G055400 [Ceratopteris richardii]